MATHQVFRQLTATLTLLSWFLILAEIPLTAQQDSRPSPRLLIQTGHHEDVNDVAYSPDGVLIATAGGDKKIKLWNATSRKLLNDLEGHSGGVSAIDFSPDSKLLASCGDNNEVFIWEVQSGRLIRRLPGHQSGVNSVAFSPDGKTLATAGGLYQEVSDNTIRIWDVETGTQLHTLKGHSSAVSDAKFALRGRALISIGNDKTIRIWSLPTGNLINSINTPDYVDAMFIVSGGTSFATLSNKVVTVWNMQGHAIRTISLPGPANVLAFSRDSNSFAFNCASTRCVEIRDVASGQLISKLEGVIPGVDSEEDIGEHVNALSFSPDGKTLITGGSDSIAKLWSRDTGRLLGLLAPSTESGGKLAVSPDGKIIAVGSGGKVVFWDTQSGKPLRVLSGHTDAVLDLAFNRDGTVLASVSAAEGVRLWSTANGQLLWSFRGKDDHFQCVAFSPDGRLLAAAGEYIQVKLLNTQSGSLIKSLVLPDNFQAVSRTPFIKANFARPVSGPGYVLSVAFSPDGNLLVAGDTFLPLHVWDVASGTYLRTIKDLQQSVNSVVFSSDGKVLITGNQENAIKFWSIAGELLRRIDEGSPVRSVALDPSGTLLANSTSAGTISLRKSSDGVLIREFRGHTSAVDTVAFGPDGKTLISGGDDGTTNLWSAGDGKLLLTLISFKDGNWLTLTPDGYYDGSAGASQYVTWRSGDRIYGAAQYQRQFNKPEIVKARLGSAVGPAVSLAVTSPSPESTPELGRSQAAADDSLRRQLPSKKFYALVIGNNNYRFTKSLTTAVRDAEDVAKMLSDDFGFQTTLLRDGTREQIMGEINRFKRELDANSNLLIYYAGHGYLDNRVKKAYWWPVNAAPGDATEWISADDITISLKGMDARHVLVVSDSCYSGAIPRGEIVGTYKITERERYLRKMMFGTSRTLIASGGNEPVEDNSGNGHSVFANAFLKGLQTFDTDIFTAEELFYEYIRIPVSGKSEQTPQFDPLYNSGHDSGVFVFIRKRSQ